MSTTKQTVDDLTDRLAKTEAANEGMIKLIADLQGWWSIPTPLRSLSW